MVLGFYIGPGGGGRRESRDSIHWSVGCLQSGQLVQMSSLGPVAWLLPDDEQILKAL